MINVAQGLVRMEKNIPINHHYVPQHFLKAWSIKGDGDKLYRYRTIHGINKFECKIVSSKKSCSQENLYTVTLPDGSFEFETIILTRRIDEICHRVLDKARSFGINNLSYREHKELAVYCACLEARHPRTIKKMDISDYIDEIRVNFKRDGSFPFDTVDAVCDYFRPSPSLGELSLAAFVKNEWTGEFQEAASDGLVAAGKAEINFGEKCLVTSNFPCYRVGNYKDNILYILAISPSRALVYASDIKTIQWMYLMGEAACAEFINFFTVAHADAAFHHSDDKGEFVKSHLGWAHRLEQNRIGDYVTTFIKSIGAGY